MMPTAVKKHERLGAYFSTALTKTTAAVVASFFICLLCLASCRAEGAWNVDNLARLAALGDKETFSFVVVGDTQGPNSKFPRILPAILEEEDLLFVFNLGDLVNYATNKEYESTFFRHVRGLRVPFLTCASNHDHFKSKNAANYSRLFGSPYYYSFRVGKAAFIVLDNGQDWSLSETQFKWLETELENARASALRFVMMHRPLRDPRNNRKKPHDMSGKMENVERLSVLFDAYNVTMIFTGHIHSFYTGKWGRTPYIITGGGGGGLYDRGTPASFHHYIHVDVTRDKAVYIVKKMKLN